VLGRIEVQGKMGKEDEADKELLAAPRGLYARQESRRFRSP
jgi:hypothetical protein